MSKLQIVNTLSRTLHKVAFTLRRHSPEILIIGGAIGTVASTVMACKATTKVTKVVEDSKAKVEQIHAYATSKEVVESGKYTDKDRKKALAIVYAQTGLEVAKLYAPAVITGTLSLGAMLTSHNIIRKRNMALVTAYTTVDKSFKEYRGRVIDRFGEELDKELKYNLKTKEVEETVVDENGKQTTVKKNVKVAQGPIYSEYALFFDESCLNWTKSPEANKTFLIQTQAWANDRLQERGHLFLNEVLDMLGAQRTQAGNQVGWMYDKDGVCCGDNYVDLRIFDQCGVEKYDERKRAFANGYERSIIIDPNVDGVILDKLP